MRHLSVTCPYCLRSWGAAFMPRYCNLCGLAFPKSKVHLTRQRPGLYQWEGPEGLKLRVVEVVGAREPWLVFPLEGPEYWRASFKTFRFARRRVELAAFKKEKP